MCCCHVLLSDQPCCSTLTIQFPFQHAWSIKHLHSLISLCLILVWQTGVISTFPLFPTWGRGWWFHTLSQVVTAPGWLATGGVCSGGEGSVGRTREYLQLWKEGRSLFILTALLLKRADLLRSCVLLFIYFVEFLSCLSSTICANQGGLKYKNKQIQTIKILIKRYSWNYLKLLYPAQ